jgi:hypothetical protein
METPMPPAVLAFGGAAVSAYGANKAAKSQSAAAAAQIELAREQRAEAREIYDDQRQVLGGIRRKNIATVRNTAAETMARERAAAQQMGQQAQGVFRANSGIARDAFGREVANFGQARDRGLGAAQTAYDRAIQAAQGGFDRETNEYRQARDANIAGFQPYADAGESAMGQIAYEMGLRSDLPQGVNALAMSPAARFALEQGRDTVEAGAAAGGGLRSGATMEALERLRMGMAAQDRETLLNRSQGIAGMGMQATGAIAGERGAFADRFGNASTNLTGARTNAANALAGNQINLWDAYAGNYGNASQAMAGGLTNAQNAYGGAMMGITGRRADNLNSMAMTRGAGIMNERTNFGQALGGIYGSFTGASNDAANMMGNALAAQGNARAAGAMGMSNAINDGITNYAGVQQFNKLLDAMKQQPGLYGGGR